MSKFLLVISLLACAALATLQFSERYQLQDPQLASLIHSLLLEDYRDQSADQFSQSLENESLGRILHRAADVFTTRVMLLDTTVSRGLELQPGPREQIVHVRFLVQKSSEAPLQSTRYLRFSRSSDNQWLFTGSASAVDYWRKFLALD